MYNLDKLTLITLAMSSVLYMSISLVQSQETPDIARGVPGLTHYIVAVNDVSHALAETDCHPERCLYQKRNFKRGDLVERLSVLAENAIGLSDVTTCIPASQTIGTCVTMEITIIFSCMYVYTEVLKLGFILQCLVPI